MLWLNKYHRGFNRLWCVFCLFPSLWLGAIGGVGFGVKTFLVCFAVGHIGFVAVWWIVRGFQ